MSKNHILICQLDTNYYDILETKLSPDEAKKIIQGYSDRMLRQKKYAFEALDEIKKHDPDAIIVKNDTIFY